MGHSFGATVVRDALRRLYLNERFDLWPRLSHVILLSGANHGVSRACGSATCGVNTTMRGRVACQSGDRDAWQPNCWSFPLNGPSGTWETPCGDGNSAFGRQGVCGGHRVRYITLAMQNLPDGTTKDLCVSEETARLAGAENLKLGPTSADESNYFVCGALRHHFGSQRSLEAMNLILSQLAR